MTTAGDADSFGPYAFALAPAEAEAAAARFGLRVALRGGLTASHLAPLAVFALIVAFASILALTGFISRRAGEATLLLAAAAFMIQRAATRWRIRQARRRGVAAMARMQNEGALTATVDANGVTLKGTGHALRVDFGDCEDAEDAGGLIYLWPRDGTPVVLPIRALPEGDAERLVAQIKARMALTRS